MPYCTACGSKVERKVKFCTNCGKQQQPKVSDTPDRQLPSRKRRRLPLILISLLVMVVLVVLGVNILHPDPDITIPDDYPNIQAAIDAANDGDVIIVEPGVYRENIDFKGKAITLRSTDPDDPEVVAATIIDGGNNGSVVTFTTGETAEALLTGFTITGGSGTWKVLQVEIEGEKQEIEGFFGGGILVAEGSSPTIEKNNITDNTGDWGGGIAVAYYSSPAITGNTITDNTAHEGGALWVSGDSTPDLSTPDDNFYRDNVPDNIYQIITLAEDPVAEDPVAEDPVAEDPVAEDPVADENVLDNIYQIITVPGDYSTIQASIDSAKDGDVIVVEPGIYRENIDFNGKAITLRSTDPDDHEVIAATIIDGGNNGSVVTFTTGETAEAVLTGFTITGGSGTWKVHFYEFEGRIIEIKGFFGGGILVANASSPTITDNIITGNSAERGGGGIAVSLNSFPTITGNIIIGNTTRGGGGISVWGDSSPTITDNTITSNTSERNGGGISVWLNSSPTIKDNTITGNTTDEWGGGIAVIRNSFPAITGNTITDNMGKWGGGISVWLNSSPAIAGNSITGNTAQEGGAIWVDDDSTLELRTPDDNVYRDNVPDNVYYE